MVIEYEVEKEKSSEKIRKFIEDFNRVAKEKKSKWFAKIKYSHPYISLRPPWFMRLIASDLSFQVVYLDWKDSFVFSDGEFDGFSREEEIRHEEFLEWFEDFKPILDGMEQRIVLRKRLYSY